MTPDDSTHDIAVKTSARRGPDVTIQAEADIQRPSEPPAGDRVAGETAPVQIHPDGR